MSTDLTVIPPVENDDLFERAATIYLDLWDENGKAPLVSEVVEHLPAYPPESIATLRTKEWDDYLGSRRKEHLMRTLAPRLMAAQLGANMGKMAGEELVRRLKETPDQLSTSALVGVMKQGYDFASNIDRDISELTGDKPQVYIDMRSIVAAGDERAFDVLQEIARRYREAQQLGS
jgi:hypothetical protein